MVAFVAISMAVQLQAWPGDGATLSPDEIRQTVEAGVPAAPESGLSQLEITRQSLPLLLEAARVTLLLSSVAMVAAVLLGICIAAGRMYGGPPMRLMLGSYVEVMCGTPLLLQLLVIYYGIASVITIDAYLAATLALALNHAARESEIFRLALERVPAGQLEAAQVLGFSGRQTLRLVKAPQMLRVALGPVTRDFVEVLKDSSLVSVIAVSDLARQTQVFATDMDSWVIPGLLCAGLYLMMALPVAYAARRVESRWKVPAAV
jgi:polar amino acid transport system substrate-binding protein